MKNTEIKTSLKTIQEQVETQTVEVAPGIEIQRITTLRISSENTASDIQEKIVDNNIRNDKNFGQFVLVEPSLLNSLQRTGWFSDNKNYSLVSKKPFTRYFETEPFEIIRLKTWDSTVFDLSGEYLPVARHFNYIDGQVCDAYFDLKALMKHLKSRSDVTIMTDIEPIPHYNAGFGCGNYCFEFLWHPDTELYREYQKLAEDKDSWESRNIAHTLMENDQFRIDPPKDCEDFDDEEDEDYND
jgi:hypothetical protein